MNTKRLTFLALAANFAVAMSPTVMLQPAAAAQECGWANENGKMVFLGTCAHDSSDDSNPDSTPTLCGSIDQPGEGVLTYRVQLATPCA